MHLNALETPCLVMAGLGVCAPEDIALSVLTSVIGHQKNKGWQAYR